MSDKKTDAAMKEKIVRCDDEVSLADIVKMQDKARDEAFEKAYSSAAKEKKRARGEILGDLIIENAFVIQDENGVTRECTQEEYDSVHQYLSNFPRSSVDADDAAIAYANAVTKPLALTKKEMKEMMEEGETKDNSLAEEAKKMWEDSQEEDDKEAIANETANLQQQVNDIMLKKGFVNIADLHLEEKQKDIDTKEMAPKQYTAYVPMHLQQNALVLECSSLENARQHLEELKKELNQKDLDNSIAKEISELKARDDYYSDRSSDLFDLVQNTRKGAELAADNFVTLEKLDKKIASLEKCLHNFSRHMLENYQQILAQIYLQEENFSKIHAETEKLPSILEKLINADKKIRATRKKRTNSVRKVGRPNANAKATKKKHRKLLISHPERGKSSPTRSNKLKKAGRKGGRS